MTLLQAIHKRRSIRNFTKKEIPKRLIKKIVKAGQRAPTSCGTQLYSFIEINDLKLRKKIIRLIGRNHTLESAPVWIFICCDVARPIKIFKILKLDCHLGNITSLLHSVIDSSLAAENMVIAAESLGLSSVFTIYHWKSLEKVSAVLGLSTGVLPILLLCMGYANEKSSLRPRWSTDIILHNNKYSLPSGEALLKEYERSNRSLVRMKYFSNNIKNLAQHWQKKFQRREMMSREKKLRMGLRKLGFLPK